MTKDIQTQKMPMWEFFNQHPSAAGPTKLGRLEQLGAGDRMAAELFVEALKRSRRVLDIGCGCGLPGLYLASHVGELVGVDAAPNMVAAAQQNASGLEVTNATFLVANATSLPFQDECFDGVSMLGLLESMDWEAVHRAMREVRRVLQPGGRIAVLDRDWSDVLLRKPRREARIQMHSGRPTLETTQRQELPGLERHSRYLVDPNSPSGQKLMSEVRASTRVTTDTGLDDLQQEDILDAWYDEGAQFDKEALASLMDFYSFSEVKVECQKVWNEGMLFATARK